MVTVPSISPLFSHLDSVHQASIETRALAAAATSSSSSPSSLAPTNNQQQYSPTVNRRTDHDSVRDQSSTSRSYENGVVAAQSLTPGSDTGVELPLTLDEDFPEPICGGCKKLIDEDSADAGVIHFATQLWHVDCFRCAKCGNLVTTDCDDILLLSDGNPICGQCNYSCQICGLPIMEEAIMTGDESYHAACFTCRSCHSPISELVFAKTSQGIYCMKCHNQRVARSRRHADRKKGISSKSKQSVSKSTASASGDKIPSASTSLEDNLLVASESEGGASTTTQPTSPTPSMGSLSPYPLQAVNSHSSENLAKRPSIPQPPSSLRELRNSISEQSWTQTPDTSNGTPLRSSFSQGDASPRNTPKLRSLLSDGETPRRESLAREETQSTSAAGLAIQSNEEGRRRSSSRGDILSAMRNDLGLPHNAEERRRSSVREEAQPATGLGLRPYRDERRRSSVLSPVSTSSQQMLATPTILQGSSASEAEVEAEADEKEAMKNVELKRASRLDVKNNVNLQDNKRMSRSFSFYDPDIVSLMDSMTHFESSDELSLDMPTSRDQLLEKGAIQNQDRASKLKAVDTLDSGEEEDSHLSSNKIKRIESTHSLKRISIQMKESIKQARDGHVSMDTKVVETILQELDTTRESIKTLQKKYDRIRRASQQAAQGFSSAREEYEHELQARYDAEAEMLGLKKQIHIQAGKLTELTQEKKQQEVLQRRSHIVKNSIQGIEKDLAKLTVERDLAVAEVSELVALQDGRSLPIGGNEENLKRALTTRLDGVKDRYRLELTEVKAEKDELLLEIEELRQTREALAEQMQQLQNRNEELAASVATLSRRVEHAQNSSTPKNGTNQFVQQAQVKPTTPTTAGFGFNFGRQNRPSTGPLSVEPDVAYKTSPLPPEPNEKIIRLAPVPIVKSEAVPRKFKWKKGAKLTAETARQASQQLAAGLQGVINPSPPVPPKATSQQSSPYGHSTSLSMQQQQQLHFSGTSSLQNSTDQSFTFNGVNHGEIVVKEHLFQPFSVLRPTRCFACQKNMWGQSEMKCGLCNQVCHIRCLQSLPTSCNQPFTRSDEAAVEYVGPTMFGRALTDQVQSEGSNRKAPLVVEQCIQAVENMGMDYEGIYRKSGGTSQLKIITQLFESRQPFNLEDSDRFNDISAITSVLKNYFRELPEPLLTYDLYQRFIDCTESKQDVAKKESEMKDLVRALPKEHFETLKMLIDHLYRIQEMADLNRMNGRNLGVVFGPTLMRSLDPGLEFAHMGGKAMTIEFMIENPQIFD